MRLKKDGTPDKRGSNNNKLTSKLAKELIKIVKLNPGNKCEAFRQFSAKSNIAYNTAKKAYYNPVYNKLVQTEKYANPSHRLVNDKVIVDPTVKNDVLGKHTTKLGYTNQVKFLSGNKLQLVLTDLSFNKVTYHITGKNISFNLVKTEKL